MDSQIITVAKKSLKKLVCSGFAYQKKKKKKKKKINTKKVKLSHSPIAVGAMRNSSTVYWAH